MEKPAQLADLYRRGEAAGDHRGLQLLAGRGAVKRSRSSRTSTDSSKREIAFGAFQRREHSPRPGQQRDRERERRQAEYEHRQRGGPDEEPADPRGHVGPAEELDRPAISSAAGFSLSETGARGKRPTPRAACSRRPVHRRRRPRSIRAGRVAASRSVNGLLPCLDFVGSRQAPSATPRASPRRRGCGRRSARSKTEPGPNRSRSAA